MQNQINYEKIRELLVAKQASGLSDRTISKQLAIYGASEAVICNIRNGKDFNKVSQRVWLALGKFCGLSYWQPAQTQNLKRTYAVCLEAQNHGIAKAIAFAPGTGKTFGLNYYANNVPNVYYIECEEHYTRKVFLSKLSQAIGIEAIGEGIAGMIDEIVKTLLSRTTTTPLLLIDEADKLRDGVINIFKTLYNKLNGHCGFVLAGTPHLSIRITKNAKRDKMAYREILSRVGNEFIPLINPTINDIRLIATANGLENESAIKSIYNASAGDLRTVQHLVTMAVNQNNTVAYNALQPENITQN
ncbi:MAG: ATP-binding protein [Sphingobacteriales bacterium]|jgi:DNA transposition AAA+ family ATPase|nr:ATP-binding protein [Sphingobacteriales bacterium]MBP9141697.1 ATP-binding protein [Chitinophagales bacterium]MDA0198492.1 ATP-binding protein [Bacteroidota bacterium]MBK6888593.1 ATP-binding protein [Sphingobacteriales bacterium]MBK7528899.1 ATP-binding protein [Sphingobacteriales bacterium]